jgi:hypothetical protein
MISLFYSTNLFWFSEKFFYSLFSGVFLFFFILAYRSIEKDQNNIISEFKKFFLLLSFVQIFIQFFFYFIFPFSFLYYAKEFFFCIQLICLFNHLCNNIEIKHKHIIEKLEKACIGMLGVLVVVLLVSIIEIRSSNECGQNLLYFRIFFLFIIWIGNLALILLTLKQIDDQLDMNFERKSEKLLHQSVNKIDEKTSMFGKLKEQKKIYLILFFSVMIGGIFKIFLQFFKLKDIYYANILCDNLYEEQNFLYDFIFTVFEIIGENSINFAIFYLYYWSLKHLFILVLDSQIDVAEGFGNTRSLLIRDYVYKPDHDILSD